MTGDARRDRVAEAIAQQLRHDAKWLPIGELADAAISAYENEPEPTPQLLVDMAQAINDAVIRTPEQVRLNQAHAALGIVVRQLNRSGWHPLLISDHLNIPESLVREMLDGK